MLRSYCRKMSDLSKNRVVSRHIVVAIDYIRSHIQENLTTDKRKKNIYKVPYAGIIRQVQRVGCLIPLSF